MSARRRLTIAGSGSPLTVHLDDPALAPDLEVTCIELPATELFQQVLRGAPFDVAELSLANFLMALAAGDRRHVGLPIFPFRSFRHAMLWVGADSNIVQPHQLRGKRIGINGYANTALVYLRGLLVEEYGLAPQDIAWVRIADERVALDLPDGVRITDLRTTPDLFALLAQGAVDAIAAFWHPDQAARLGTRRLFADVAAVEADYYRRTRIHPIMHLVVLRRDLYDADPAIAATIARLFGAAKQRYAAAIRRFGAERIAVTPWMPLALEEASRLFGGDLHPYGLMRNRETLAAITRYAHAQGLTARGVGLDELFAPEAVAVFDDPAA